MKLPYVIALVGLLLATYTASVLYRASELRRGAKRTCAEALQEVVAGKLDDSPITDLRPSGAADGADATLRMYLDKIRKSSGDILGISNIRVRLSSEKPAFFPNIQGVAYCFADFQVGRGTAGIMVLLAMNEWNVWEVRQFAIEN